MNGIETGKAWFLDEEPCPLNIWRDKYGVNHYISDMDTKHIKNCIDLIKSKKNWRVEFLKPLEIELLRRKYSFSCLNKPIEECSDSELLSWLISFLNGFDATDREVELYNAFDEECKNRSEEFNNKVKEIYKTFEK